MAQSSRLINPLTTHDLQNVLKILPKRKNYYLNVLSYDALLENKFPQNDFAIIFNTLTSYQSGLGHWCVIFNDKHSKTYTYFNSLNDHIDERVQNLIESRLMRGERLISNAICLQKTFSNVCGYLCVYILKCLMNGMNLNEIIEYDLNMYNFNQIEDKVIQYYFDILINH